LGANNDDCERSKYVARLDTEKFHLELTVMLRADDCLTFCR